VRQEIAAFRPAQTPGLAAHRESGSLTIEDAAGTRRYAVNATALAVWDLCDGATSAAEMIEAMTSIFDAPPDVVEHDVVSVLDHLASLGLISPLPWSEGW
jgi:hypothetical protein